MIYAIILIVLGLIAILFNTKPTTKTSVTIKAWLAPLFIIWGTVGIIILSTIRFSVFDENSIYWVLLIIGSLTEIVIGALFIFRLIRFKRDQRLNDNFLLPQTILAIVAILVGVATILVK